MYQEKLADIGSNIINSTTIQEEIDAAKMLAHFFSTLEIFNFQSKSQQKETVMPGGVALSISGAADCVDDYLRTTRFIKGAYQAMEELVIKFPNGTSSILYAGCGPYATILLPLLPLFSEKNFEIVLLDINEASIQYVNTLLEKLSLQHYKIKTVCGNAITYTHKHYAEKPLCLIVTETMFNALIREPQVAITANLAPQLAEGGILIPQEITLTAAYSFFAHEPFLKSGTDAFINQVRPVKYAQQQLLGTLFSMNKDHNSFCTKEYGVNTFESKFYKVPKEFSQFPDICIYTNIQIFNSITLHSAQSYITNPYCVGSLYNFTNGANFKLLYNFKDIPTWTYEVK